MLYVIILYCTGFCPAELIGPPSDVQFFSSYADCKAALVNRGDLQLSPNPLPGSPIKTEERETCARVFADPKQLDRLLKPDQLRHTLDAYNVFGDGWKPWVPQGCDGKTVCTPNDMVGPCGKGMDFGCLFKPKEAEPKSVCLKGVFHTSENACVRELPLCENALTGKPMSCSGEGARNCFDPKSVDPVSCAGSVPANKGTVP